KVVLSNGEKLIDENVRRVLRAKVRRQNEDFVSRRLGALQPRLEEHFAVSLTASESPEFLVYNEGGFYAPHTDGTRSSHSAIRRRRVSVVVFLNSESNQSAQGCYCGGKLTFHGILNEPQWTDCAFSLDPNPGLLVAFRSDLVH